MNNADLARIRSSEGWRRDRIEAFETADGSVVVKGQRAARSGAAALMLDVLAHLVRVPVLRAGAAPGGAAGQALEVRRLAELRAAGVPVPAVVHVDPDFFAMERLEGPNLVQRLAADPAEAPRLWQQGLRFLRRVHAAGQCLSNASARNLVLTGQGLVAIDFEEDPLQAMDLQHAQVRDWLLYLHSTVWLLDLSPRQLLPLWEQAGPHGRHEAATLDCVAQLRWLRHLPRRRRPWGRDVIGLQAASSLMDAWVRRRQAS